MCSPGVLPIEADAAVCWERTHTTDKLIHLANLIKPQVLPLRRISPSCHDSDTYAGSKEIYLCSKGSAVQREGLGPNPSTQLWPDQWPLPFPSARDLLEGAHQL